MKAVIKIKYAKDPIKAKETFETLKRRLYNADNFIYVSTDRKKIVLNKNIIIAIKTVAEEPAKKKKD